jgi:hypothetical protein
MRIRLTQVILTPVITLFCMLAFSSTLPGAGQDPSLRSPGESGVFFTATDRAGNPHRLDVVGDRESVMQEPLLLAAVTTVFVCHFLPNSKSITQELPLATAQKLIAEHPQEWVMGTCEDVISPS